MSASTPSPFRNEPSRPSGDDLSARRSWQRAAALNVSVWAGVVLLHTMATYGDQVRRGGTVAFAEIVATLALAYAPWVVFTLILTLRLRGQPGSAADPRALMRLFLWSLPAFLLPQVAYQVLLSVWSTPDPLAAFMPALRGWRSIFWLIDSALLVGTFAVVAGAVAITEGMRAERRRARAAAELAAARLELGHYRLRSLRAQLEPHFLFNTLNAISGLVRSDDRALAVTALQELSAMLRYALDASQRDWVTLQEELSLVALYLGLQRMRYGERLRVETTVSIDATQVDCPPLLLQPLMENAIRHDVERHDGVSDIRVAVDRVDDRIRIEVRNRVRPGAPPNPGSGLGLRATRDRLHLLYGGRAALETTAEADYFTVTVTLPADGHV